MKIGHELYLCFRVTLQYKRVCNDMVEVQRCGPCVPVIPTLQRWW